MSEKNSERKSLLEFADGKVKLYAPTVPGGQYWILHQTANGWRTTRTSANEAKAVLRCQTLAEQAGEPKSKHPSKKWLMEFAGGRIKLYAPKNPGGQYRILHQTVNGWKDTRTSSDEAKAVKRCHELARRTRETLDKGRAPSGLSIQDAEKLKVIRGLGMDELMALRDSKYGGQRILVSEAIDKHIEELEAKRDKRAPAAKKRGEKPSKQHLDTFVRRSHQLRRRFGGDGCEDRWMDSISPDEVKQWIDDLSHLAPRTIENYTGVLRTIANRAKEWRNVPGDFDPFRSVDMPEDDRETAAYIWEPEHLHDILTAISAVEGSSLKVDAHGARYTLRKDRAICLVALLAFCGLRPTEAAGVKGERDGILWEDINPRARTVFVRHSKNGKSRLIRLGPTDEGMSRRSSDRIWGALWGLLGQFCPPDVKPFLDPSRATPEQLKNGHPVAPRTGQRNLSLWLRKNGFIGDGEEWAQDGFRKSWFSAAWALGIPKLYLCDLNDNSEEMFKKHYKVPRSVEWGEAWFGVRAGNERPDPDAYMDSNIQPEPEESTALEIADLTPEQQELMRGMLKSLKGG